jgi:signal transduction histidine kinase
MKHVNAAPDGVRATVVPQEAASRPLPAARFFPFSSALLAQIKAACQRVAGRERVRAWVPACKTGGLAYGVAMLLHEQASDLTRIQVFGTDENDAALTFARGGRYPVQAALGLDPALRGGYTFDLGDTIRVAESLRGSCLFSQHRLAHQAPFSRMDLVVCHRVFEHVPPALRNTIVQSLHFALRAGGILVVLDHAELFPAELFERLPEGYLRARTPSQRAPRRPGTYLTAKAAAMAPTPPSSPSELEQFAKAAGLSFLLLDRSLTLLRVSSHAERTFALSSAHQGLPLHSVLPLLPGGTQLLTLTEQVVSSGRPAERLLRDAGHTYLARAFPAELLSDVSVGLLLSDTTGWELNGTRDSEPPARNAIGAASGEPGTELEAVYDALPMNVSIHGLDGRIQRINRRLEQVARAEMVEGSGLTELYKRELPTWIEHVIATGKPVDDLEIAFGADAGQRVWCCNLAPIRDGAGRVSGASVVTREISERKRSDALLRDQQKYDFLALLGHELRDPLAAIRGATELLNDIDDVSPQLLRIRGLLAHQSLQMSRLVDDLLDIPRVATDELYVPGEPLNLTRLLKQVVGERETQFRQGSLTLEVPEGEVWLSADGARISQIINNLLSNALRFTRPGAAMIVTLRLMGGRAGLCVADDGVGIDSALLEGPVVEAPSPDEREAARVKTRQDLASQ